MPFMTELVAGSVNAWGTESKRKIEADRKLGEQILTGMVNAIKEQI